MLPTPVRRSALDYFLGVGGSGRRPVEFADPTWGAGVWTSVRVALENPSTFNRPAASSADPQKHCSLVPGTDHRVGDVNRISNTPFRCRSGPQTLSEDPPEVSRHPRGSHRHSRRTPRGPRASKRDACAVNHAFRAELGDSLSPSAPPP